MNNTQADHSGEHEPPPRTAGRGDWGHWDPTDEPTADEVHPFALNNPPSVPLRPGGES